MVKETKRTTEQQLVLFDLAAEHYAIDSMNVREIIRMQVITKIPGAPASVEGVINLRGKVTPVSGRGWGWWWGKRARIRGLWWWRWKDRM
jgi:chemotaxis signal transduction protein